MRFRVILPIFEVEKLYTEITDLQQFNNLALWRGNTPSYAVVELQSEEDLRNWYRGGVHAPSRLERWHTLKVMTNTNPISTKERTVLYAYLEIKQMFSNKIPIYTTNAGRIVTPLNLTYALVTMVRNVRGEPVDALRAYRPMPGPPQVRDVREPQPAEHYYRGTNTGGLGPLTTTTTETRDGKKLKTNFIAHIHTYCDGTNLEQHIKEQMCRGRYKTTRCTNAPCNKHRTNECPFRHPDDNMQEIMERTARVRHEIFTQMDEDNYALPLEHLLEIGAIDQETYDASARAKWEHDQRVADNREYGKGAKGGKRDRSRSPSGSNPRTPPPKGKGKGQLKGKDAAPTPAESIAATPAITDSLTDADRRQRDHTSGGDEQSDAEVAAPPPADNTAEEPANMEGIADNDNLPDFGSPSIEPKEETDEPMGQTANVTIVAPAADAEYTVVTGVDIDLDQTISA